MTNNDAKYHGSKIEPLYFGLGNIQKIIAKRENCRHGIEYLVRWLGYGPEEDSWRRIPVLTNSLELVQDFDNAHSELTTETITARLSRHKILNFSLYEVTIYWHKISSTATFPCYPAFLVDYKSPRLSHTPSQQTSILFSCVNYYYYYSVLIVSFIDLSNIGSYILFIHSYRFFYYFQYNW